MRDRNGAELKPGDECEFTCRVKVSETQHALGVLVHRSDSEYATAFIATPSKLTKVQPEFEWTVTTDSVNNSEWRCHSNGTFRGSTWLTVYGDRLMWTYVGDRGIPVATLEAAKSEVERLAREAAK